MPTIKEKSEAMRKNLTDELLGLIETKGLEWCKDWNANAFCPVNGDSNRRYRGINRMYLAWRAIEAGYKDPRWITFASAKRSGFHVRKGEKSAAIEYWRPSPCIKDPNNPAKLKFLKKNELEKYDPETVKHVMVLAAIFNVFNFEQLDGAPAYVIHDKPEANWEIADTLIESSLCPVCECASESAFYSLTKDRITLPLRESFVDEDSFNATLIHEMAHSTGHRDRLDREEKMKSWFGSEKYAAEELRAEFSSAFVQAQIGVSLSVRTTTNHAAYLQSWLKACKEDSNALISAISDAEKIADFLVDNYERIKLTPAADKQNPAA